MQSEKMVKQPWKRSLALLLAVLCLLSSVLVAASALTESDSGHWEVLGHYGSGANWKYDFQDGSGKKTWGLQHTFPFAEVEKLCFHTSAGHNLAYCMEMGSGADQHANVTVWSNFAGNLHNAANLTRDQKKTYIERAFFYGYSGGAARYGHTTDEERYATQLMIWMIASGDNDPDCDSKIADDSVFNQYSTSLNDRENGFVNKCTINVPAASKNAIIDTLRKMKEQMVTHDTIPSFMTKDKSLASTKIRQLNYNSATGFYENVTRLPDDHGVISYYESATDGVIFKIENNVLKIQTKKIIPANAPLTITAERKRAKYSNPVYLKVGGWSKVAGQIGCAAITGNTDPVRAYMSIWTNSTGSLKITKTSSVLTGDPALSVSGVQFRVTGPNSFDKTVTTGADGTFTLTNIAAGTYTVTELNVKNYWWPQSAKTVTVTSDATASVSFQNGYKHGHVDVTKTAEDGLAKGTKFHLYGTADCGAKVDRTETVGDDGQAHFSNVLIGKYTLEEVDAPVRYVVPTSQNVTVEWDKHATATFTNKLIKGSLKIVKKDSMTKQPIQGAHFQLISSYGDGGTWEENKVVGEGYTNAKGELVFENLHYGAYIFMEDIIPEGYTGSLISSEYYFEITKDGDTVVKEVTNTPITGKVKIRKIDSETGEPLAGVHFGVYKYAEGAYTGAAGLGAKVADGYTDTKGELELDIPLGHYCLKEEAFPKGYEGYPVARDYVFDITKKDEVVTKEIKNTPLKGNLKIIKKDADTGERMPGVLFVLKERIGDTWTFKEVDRKYTDSNGEALFENLLAGDYYYEEYDTLWGYETDRTLHSATIVGYNQTVTVELTNKATYDGYISIHKTDEEGNGLAGVKFLLEYSLDKGATWSRVQFRRPDNPDITIGGCTTLGLVDGVCATNAQGDLKFSGLRLSVPSGNVQYRVTEVETLPGYQLLTDPVFEGELDWDEYWEEPMPEPEIIWTTLTVVNKYEAIPGSISIHKTNELGDSLAGVKFLLEYSENDGKTWSPVQSRADGTRIVAGGCTSAGLENGTLVTDADGNVVFSGLRVSNKDNKIKYRVTEVETLQGYQLLADPVYEGELSQDTEIDVSFTVVNTHTYALPPTGSIGYCLMTVVAGVFAVGAIGCAVVLWKKRRKIY